MTGRAEPPKTARQAVCQTAQHQAGEQDAEKCQRHILGQQILADFLQEAEVDAELQFAIAATFEANWNSCIQMIQFGNSRYLGVDRRNRGFIFPIDARYSLTCLIEHDEVSQALQLLRRDQRFPDSSVIVLCHRRANGSLEQKGDFRSAQFKLTGQIRFGQSLAIPDNGAQSDHLDNDGEDNQLATQG